MSMNPSSDDESGFMAEMNTTPLIDVMLVLLIMLIITVPLQTHAVKLDLPAPVPSAAAVPPPEVVTVSIDFDGTLLWDGIEIAGLDALELRVRQLGLLADQPEFHIRPHKLAPYRVVAAVMARAQRQGLKRIGIVGGEQFVNP